MKLNNKSLQISCDGGAATGKSTGGKLISKKLNLKFLSSGLLYRYASYLILKKKQKNRIIFLKKKFKQLNYKKLEKINLHSQDISEYTSIIPKPSSGSELLLQRCPGIKWVACESLLTVTAKLPLTS